MKKAAGWRKSLVNFDIVRSSFATPGGQKEQGTSNLQTANRLTRVAGVEGRVVAGGRQRLGMGAPLRGQAKSAENSHCSVSTPTGVGLLLGQTLEQNGVADGAVVAVCGAEAHDAAARQHVADFGLWALGVFAATDAVEA